LQIRFFTQDSNIWVSPSSFSLVGYLQEIHWGRIFDVISINRYIREQPRGTQLLHQYAGKITSRKAKTECTFTRSFLSFAGTENVAETSKSDRERKWEDCKENPLLY